MRIVLPYTERWNGLAKKLKELQELYDHTFLQQGFKFKTQVAFRRGDKPLCFNVRYPVAADLNVFREVAHRRGR